MKSQVYIVKTEERTSGLDILFQTIKIPDLQGKAVVIKPNFNSDDPFPATTNLETLEYVINKIKAANPKSITIVERSGMGDTQTVLKNRGVLDLADKYGVKIINLDKLPAEGWLKIKEPGNHWLQGFLVAKVIHDADYVVNLPCLKTHRFGGDFTLSLKNNVGAIAKWKPGGVPYNYMWELHTARNQRLMIAEINKYIPVNLIVMDGLAGFADKGPDVGKLIKPGLMLVSDDRVAIDAVGVAVLRLYGTTEKVTKGKIFDQDQIKRAAQLGIGVSSPDKIEIVPLNQESKDIAAKIRQELQK